MEFNIKEPRDIGQLRKIIKDMDSVPDDISIRVENNIFTIDGNWLLRKKDGKLENINVLLGEDEGDTQNFRSKLRKEIEGLKGSINVDIKKLLYTRLDTPNLPEGKPCLTLSYLSILETGNSADIEKWKDKGFIWQDIGKIDRRQLTPSTSYTYGVIRQNEQEIRNLLKRYREFDEKKFDQYFLHGMENRYDLLEGIMYYTNRDLTAKYLELVNGENFPTTGEKLEILKRETTKKYEQLYRFIYVLDGEDARFDYTLRAEEEEQINEMVEDTLQGLIDKEELLFFKRGIFFNDRTNDAKGFTYDKVRGYTWTGEVYKVLQQLEFMERIDGYQYYKRWLQAKICRLKVSNQYPKGKISKLEEIYENFFNGKQRIEEKNAEKS